MVGVLPRVADLRREPCHTSPLPSELFLNKVSDM